MQEHQNQKNRLEDRLLEVIDFYRGMILDMTEQELAGTDNWSFLRSRLLKAMGDRGLVGRVREVLNNEFQIKE
jgi:hypothetical protein